MDLRHLRYFVMVARERNFTRAAELLHVTQPPLSRQIQQLEDDLGAKLFERDSRPVKLTAAGRFFYEHAVQVLDRVEEMRAMMERFVKTEHPTFVIGFVASTLYGSLPEVIRHFRAAAPEVEVRLLEMTTLEQIAALKEGRIDAGFGRVRFDDPAITRTILREEPLVVAAPADHPLAARGTPVSLSELVAEPLIIYPRSPRPSYADQVLSVFRDHGLKPRIAHEVRELQTAIGLVASQAGVCLVPASVQRLRRDDVAYLPLVEQDARSPIIISQRASDRSPNLARLFEASHLI
jgi:DNA-binding transcriptional LysR family regulator